MAHIHEPHLDARSQLNALVVVHTHEQLHGRLGVLHGIHGLHQLGTGALGLAVLPLGLELLDVGRVPQHDTAQLHRGVGGVDFAPEAVAHQQRQHTGVVDVRMGSQHPVDLAGCHRDGLVLVDIPALLHAAVDQEPTTRGFQQRTAAGDLMVRAQKRDLHPKTPPVIQANFSGRPAVSTQNVPGLWHPTSASRLNGVRVLSATAPTAAPCFHRRWRLLLLHSIALPTACGSRVPPQRIIRFGNCRPAIPSRAFLFCAFSIAHFKGTRRTNRRDFCGQSAERSKKFLYNLDKLPHSVINLDLYDVRSYFMSLK